MNTDERLSGALQENILVLLCFDPTNCKLIRSALTPQLFESAIYREVAGIAIDFIDQYSEPVGEHLPDHLEHILKGEDKRKAASYERLIKELFTARDSVNGEYVLSQLHKFVRQQGLKAAVLRSVEALEDGRIDDAEVELQKGLNHQVIAFSAGLNLSDPRQTASLLSGDLEEEGFRLGIKELDAAGIMPRVKEQLLFIAPRKRGKSWFCTHTAKMALLQGWPTLVVSLEMSEKRYAVRFLQSFFSISKREASVRVTRFVQDKHGRLEEIIQEQVERMTLADPNIQTTLTHKIQRHMVRRPPLVIKAFPTGSLTLEELEAYLDGLERFEKFTPKCIIVDYPDLMKHDIKNKRLEIGQINERLRGLGVKRNAAIVVCKQGNRESEGATTVTADMAAEDISALATADTVLTHSQTAAEKKLGLARLLVAAARNDSDGFSVLMSQAYAIGQFCLDSTIMGERYVMGSGATSAPERERDTDDDDPPQRRGPRVRRER